MELIGKEKSEKELKMQTRTHKLYSYEFFYFFKAMKIREKFQIVKESPG